MWSLPADWLLSLKEYINAICSGFWGWIFFSLGIIFAFEIIDFIFTLIPRKDNCDTSAMLSDILHTEKMREFKEAIAYDIRAFKDIGYPWPELERAVKREYKEVYKKAFR
jgi:hypothetical protein